MASRSRHYWIRSWVQVQSREKCWATNENGDDDDDFLWLSWAFGKASMGALGATNWHAESFWLQRAGSDWEVALQQERWKDSWLIDWRSRASVWATGSYVLFVGQKVLEVGLWECSCWLHFVVSLRVVAGFQSSHASCWTHYARVFFFFPLATSLHLQFYSVRQLFDHTTRARCEISGANCQNYNANVKLS